MNLIENKTGKRLKCIIEPVSKKELKELEKNNDFSFDWNLEIENKVYKIRLEKNREILGLMSLTDFQEEFPKLVSSIFRGTSELQK